MNTQEEVLGKYPAAYLYYQKSLYEIRRPRERSDPAALVKYVLMSGQHWTHEAAWSDALSRLQNLESA